MAKQSDMNENLFCSFCGKNQKEVKKLIAGPAVYICDECIQLCGEIIDEETDKEKGLSGDRPISDGIWIYDWMTEEVSKLGNYDGWIKAEWEFRLCKRLRVALRETQSLSNQLTGS